MRKNCRGIPGKEYISTEVESGAAVQGPAFSPSRKMSGDGHRGGDAGAEPGARSHCACERNGNRAEIGLIQRPMGTVEGICGAPGR